MLLTVPPGIGRSGISLARRPLSTITRRLVRPLIGIFVLLTCSIFVFATPLYAGTVIIIDNPSTLPPVNSVYTDAYIQAYLTITGSLSIDTADSLVVGMDNIYVQPGVEIVWTTGNTLTLLADANVVVSGTIQHNGPADGSGGVALLANNDHTDGGDVLLGLGTQPNSIAVGSRHALTRIDGANVRLRAGNGANFRHAQIGYRTVNAGAAYRITGAISVTAEFSVTALGGSSYIGYVQIGHGGSDPNNALDGIMTGTVSIVAGDSISFTAGSGDTASAQVGNGGWYSEGVFGGNHSLRAITGDIHFSAVGGAGYVQVGNGGEFMIGGVTTGDMRLYAGRDIIFTAGDVEATYALVGNGGQVQLALLVASIR